MKYSNKTNRILKTMYKKGSVNRNQISHSVLRELFQDRYIANSNNYHDANIYITDEGRAYVEELKSDKHHFWIPVIISLVALFRPEIISLVKYFVTLLIEK